jgi:glutathione S-transferase
MTITLTTMGWVPPVAVGLVRDLRVRWALEEAGRPYQTRMLSMEEKSAPEYRQQQPFGQVPVYQEDELTLFESGAIVHHIARDAPVLMPADAAGRAQTLTWMFAALNSVEPHVQNLASQDFFFSEEEGAAARRVRLDQMADSRLADLNNWLRDREYLTGQFSGADILMATVLNLLRHTDMVKRHAALHAYHQRCLARPAYLKALAAQQAVYAAAPTAAG